MSHCMWPGCRAVVPPTLWGCKPHWYRLPREIRTRILASYRYGQTIATASPEWTRAVEDAERWIHEHAGEGAPVTPVRRRAEVPAAVTKRRGER